MGTTLRRISRLAARAVVMWLIFVLVYAALGYFFTDRGRSFLSLLPGAAVAGALFLVFYAVSLGYTVRRRRQDVAGKSGQARPSDDEFDGSRHG